MLSLGQALHCGFMGAHRSAKVIAAVFLAACALPVGVASADPAPPTPGPLPGPPGPLPGPPPGPSAAPMATIDRDGTFTVGTDIVAGTYTSLGPVDGGTCYWKRVAPDQNIIDNALSKKPQTVEILASDSAFKTNGCQPWQLTDVVAPSGVPPPIAGVQLQGMLAEIIARAGRLP
jgi:hypothetical protein